MLMLPGTWLPAFFMLTQGDKMLLKIDHQPTGVTQVKGDCDDEN
jgi:hypothetical protein